MNKPIIRRKEERIPGRRAQPILNSFYYDPTNTGPVAYETFSFNEKASTDLTTFYFHAIDSYGSILVDNVSVSPVPEPATWGLLALGSAGLLSLRARNKHPARFAP